MTGVYGYEAYGPQPFGYSLYDVVDGTLTLLGPWYEHFRDAADVADQEFAARSGQVDDIVVVAHLREVDRQRYSARSGLVTDEAVTTP